MEQGRGERLIFLSAHRCPEVDLLPQDNSVTQNPPQCSRVTAQRSFTCSGESETSCLDTPLTCRSGKQEEEEEEGSISDWSEEDLSLHFSPSVILQSDDEDQSDPESGFECIDVTMETLVGEGPKMVPKRQIQLKRKKDDKNNNKPQVKLEDSLAEGGGVNNEVRHGPDLLRRQHSLPASLHTASSGVDSYRVYRGHVAGASQGFGVEGHSRQRLQKSFSLDETKTKMATCIIQSILSKKMQVERNSCRSANQQKKPSAPISVEQRGRRDRVGGQTGGGVFKAPVYVVRDMRKLVKDTCSLDFTTPDNSFKVKGQEESPPPTYQQAVGVKGHNKASEYSITCRGHVAKVAASLSQSHNRNQREQFSHPITHQRHGSEPLVNWSKANDVIVSVNPLGPPTNQPVSCDLTKLSQSERGRGKSHQTEAFSPAPVSLQRGSPSNLLHPQGPQPPPSNLLHPQGPQSPLSNLLHPQGPQPPPSNLLHPQGPRPPPSTLLHPQGPQSPLSTLLHPQGPQSPPSTLLHPQGPQPPPSTLLHPQGPQSPLSTLLHPQGPQSPPSTLLHPQGPQSPPSNLLHPQGPQSPPSNLLHPQGPQPPPSNLLHPQGPQSPLSTLLHPQGPQSPPSTLLHPQGPQPPASNLLHPQGPQSPLSTLLHPQGPQPPASNLLHPQGPQPPPSTMEQSSTLGLSSQFVPRSTQQILQPCFYPAPVLPMYPPILHPHIGKVSYVNGPLNFIQTSLQPNPPAPTHHRLRRSQESSSPENTSGCPDHFCPQEQSSSEVQMREGSRVTPAEQEQQKLQEQQQHLCSLQDLLPAQVGSDFIVDITGSAAARGAVLSGPVPCHFMFDPRSGRCFYMDTPTAPQRKMLLDPETGQYVYVFLPAASSAPNSGLISTNPTPIIINPAHHLYNPAPTVISMMQLQPTVAVSSLYPGPRPPFSQNTPSANTTRTTP